MTILSLNVNTTGLVGSSVTPRRCTMTTTDSLATVTASGYLNAQNSLGNTLMPNDIFDVIYNYNVTTGNGSFATLNLTYATGNFTLNASPALTNAVLNNIVNQMQAGSEIKLDKGTVTTTGGLATVNKQVAILTTESLTTIAGAAYTITLTNSFVLTSSAVLVTANGGTNTNAEFSISATAGNGTSTIVITNIGPTAALNGTIKFSFVVL